MKQLLFVLFVLISFSSISQNLKFGIINDPDGYTNVRSEPRGNSKIIRQINENEVFSYTYTDSHDWYEVTLINCHDSNNTTYFPSMVGYMHKSRVRDLDSLEVQKKGDIIKAIFDKEIALYKKTDTSSHCEWVNFHERIFDPNLKFITKFICNTNDEELFRTYIELILIEGGSADESPRFALGDLYMCQEGMIETIIKEQVGNSTLLQDLEWGVVPYIYRKEDQNSKRIKKKLKEYRVLYNLDTLDYDNYY